MTFNFNNNIVFFIFYVSFVKDNCENYQRILNFLKLLNFLLLKNKTKILRDKNIIKNKKTK